MHRKVAAALVAVLALGIASCGGTETTTLGRAALVRRLELACRQGQSAAEREARRTRVTRGLNITPILTAHEVIVERIEEVDTSGSAKAGFDAFKTAVKERLELIQQVADADRADQPRVIRSVQDDAARWTRRLEAAARELGVFGCS